MRQARKQKVRVESKSRKKEQKERAALAVQYKPVEAWETSTLKQGILKNRFN